MFLGVRRNPQTNICPFKKKHVETARDITAAGLAQSIDRLTAKREVAGLIPGTGPTVIPPCICCISWLRCSILTVPHLL